MSRKSTPYPTHRNDPIFSLVDAENTRGLGEVQVPIAAIKGYPQCPVVVDAEWFSAHPYWRTARPWQRKVLELRYPISRPGFKHVSRLAMMTGAKECDVRDFLESDFALEYADRALALAEEYEAAKQEVKERAAWKGHAVVSELADGAASESVKLNAAVECMKHGSDFQQVSVHEHNVHVNDSRERRMSMEKRLERMSPGAAERYRRCIDVTPAGGA